MSLVQAVAADAAGSGGALAITISASASGSTLVVIIGSPNSITTPTVTDNKSNTYTQVLLNSAAGVSPSGLFVCPNATSGVTTVTVGGASVAKLTVFVCEESGLATSSTVDKSNLAANQSATGSPTTSNVTTTSANETAYSYHNFGNGTVSFTAGTGWTAITGTGITAGQHDNSTAGASLFVERRTLSSTSTLAGTATVAGTPTGIDSGIITLVQVASGPSIAVLSSNYYRRRRLR